ncbi:MAG: site-2 protease family protein [Trichodesmium sp. St16_bin4-tuft]|uniref:Zinc metalloprotease n=1 Tax=Trichodesmium erythraeum (strain IMS101) TaxID=203124 RepID=Q10ZK9_TRIEI|nr:site-2 protease family protein [Trichodesmium erythraeum GBRTRLIN201]MCL2929831.1 site-2 protease family protein [Trichodesmium sp. MAG_R01]MDE5074162.1 site-2 protease family protein [Trichodesmium sp. St5_bin8]MDE5078038.1 site-2 protease family protein [Trichodesmium sp. St2_bin6]MDE5100566.1 site-2 protease family protein [Trichodesmium sp. St16_bin4-tuft]MDE5104185.1 site-2 protease family protein [Trichodesmium sp. St19_bin2]
MNGSFRVGNLFGIPFYINSSWFIVLGLLTLTYGNDLATQFSQELGNTLPWILGLITALLLFSSVLAHELGHSFVALYQGIKVKSITLFLFGGLASLDRESKTPIEAFLVAIAGPLVSILLCGFFVSINIFTSITGPAESIVQLLAYINLFLALFNLIPGLPLDGGNILKSIVWKITNNPYKGIIFASRVGQVFGCLAIISGLIPAFLFSRIPNFWNILIGWFLLQNAGRSAQYGEIQGMLADLNAVDAIIPDNPIVSNNLSLREFVNEYVIGKEARKKFLVINEMGQFVGVINVDDLKIVNTSQWPLVQVKTLTKPLAKIETVTAKTSLLEVISLLEQKQISELTVIDENGILVGSIEKASIRRLLTRKEQAKTN